MIEVIDPGFLTTIQDMGRVGQYHLGVPPSGAADKFSFSIGNMLVGNPTDFPAFEMTLIGGEYLFHKDYVIALTGAPMHAFLNGKRVPLWEALHVKAGDLLKIDACDYGVITYLCISGGIFVPEVLGSKSTYELSKIGGFRGRRLQKFDHVPVNEPLPGAFKQVGKKVPPSYIPTFPSFQEIRATLGLSGYLVSDEGLKSFLNSDWTVSYESNRIAYRFTGAKVSFVEIPPPFGAGNSLSNVVDFAYPIGSIMFMNEEELIVLLNDGTTGGGFVTVGTVISQDLNLIAQLRPKSKCRFISVTIEQALQARKEQNETFLKLQELLKNE